MSAWTRHERIGAVDLYLGRALDVVPALGPVDVVITDPPYAEHTHKQAKTNQGAGHGRSLITFSALDDAGFLAVAEGCLAAAQSWVVMTCDFRHAALLYGRPEFVRLGAWVKPNPMPQISADRPGQGFETVAILHSGRVPKAWNRGGGAGVWTVPPHSGALVPTQKPLALIGAFVSDFTKPGDVVLDPFCGSGTTLVACAKAGRRAIGVEVDPQHFDIACRRADEAQRQTDLFISAPAPAPVQEALL